MSPMQPQPISLTIFFPCHNEQDNVERVCLQAMQCGTEMVREVEVIIVNDGSTDDTAAIADRLSATHPEVRVVHHPTNLGYGAALCSGFAAARKDWIFYTDGDGQFDLRELAKLLPLRGPQVVVSGYRQQRQDSALRKLNAWCWSLLMNLLFDMRVRDIDCAFKLYPAKLFSQMELRSSGALIDTEILAKATRLGYEIRQIGVSHHPRVAGQQSGASVKVILRAFKELFKLRRHILQSPTGGETRGDVAGSTSD